MLDLKTSGYLQILAGLLLRTRMIILVARMMRLPRTAKRQKTLHNVCPETQHHPNLYM